MSKFKFKAYPKPWEIALSRFLSPALGVVQIGVIVYAVMLLCAPHIIWTQIMLLAMMLVATNFCFKNVQGILGLVKNDDDKSGE
ncbi:MAG: hypothetical protein JHC33_12515 [Ignisphaera sp.]|nr:hypothetical protein [Ignisphaera sp.]